MSDWQRGSPRGLIPRGSASPSPMGGLGLDFGESNVPIWDISLHHPTSPSARVGSTGCPVCRASRKNRRTLSAPLPARRPEILIGDSPRSAFGQGVRCRNHLIEPEDRYPPGRSVDGGISEPPRGNVPLAHVPTWGVYELTGNPFSPPCTLLSVTRRQSVVGRKIHLTSPGPGSKLRIRDFEKNLV